MALATQSEIQTKQTGNVQDQSTYISSLRTSYVSKAERVPTSLPARVIGHSAFVQAGWAVWWQSVMDMNLYN